VIGEGNITGPLGFRNSSVSTVRLVLAKCGLDAHERGVHVIALGLRDFGFEVIYLGLRRSPEEIVSAAMQEDADVIGLSSLSGAHNRFVPRVAAILEREHFSPLLVVGGMIPDEDIPMLLNHGVDRVYGQGSAVAEIARDLADLVRRKQETE